MDTIADRLIIALDTDDLDHAQRLVQTLHPFIRTFKVGIRLFTAVGPKAVTMVQEAGGEVFLDLKFLDIPASVAGAVANAARMGVFMINVHAVGGRAMLQQARLAAARSAEAHGKRRPLLLAVTLLTSADAHFASDQLPVPGEQSVESYVVHLACMAADEGLDGVVASPLEARVIKAACGEDFLVVSPGIRPRWAAADDQRRILPPQEALAMGADFLVVGRPVIAAADPLEAVQRIIQEA